MYTFIDVSRVQNGIDFAATGVGGAIIKASGANDDLYVAGGYAAHVANARRVFGNVGHYFFNGPAGTPTEAANYFVDNLDWRVGDALFLDIEEEPEAGGVPVVDIYSPDEAYEFLLQVKARRGVVPALYMSEWVANNADWSKCLKLGAKIWPAKYSANTGTPGTEPVVTRWGGSGGWALWQYTSRGRVPGWAGDVDLNYSRLKMQEVHPMPLNNYRLRTPDRVISDDANDPYVSWANHLARTSGLRGGVDLIAAVGTPIYARTAGRMIQIPDDGSAGNSCRFYHRDNVGWKDVFSHLSSYRTPKNPNGLNAFDYEAGDIVAYSGNSGNVVQHLHWHLLDVDGIRRNPWDYFSSAEVAGIDTEELLDELERGGMIFIKDPAGAWTIGDAFGNENIAKLNDDPTKITNQMLISAARASERAIELDNQGDADRLRMIIRRRGAQNLAAIRA